MTPSAAGNEPDCRGLFRVIEGLSPPTWTVISSDYPRNIHRLGPVFVRYMYRICAEWTATWSRISSVMNPSLTEFEPVFNPYFPRLFTVLSAISNDLSIMSFPNIHYYWPEWNRIWSDYNRSSKILSLEWTGTLSRFWRFSGLFHRFWALLQGLSGSIEKCSTENEAEL